MRSLSVNTVLLSGTVLNTNRPGISDEPGVPSTSADIEAAPLVPELPSLP